MTLEELEKELRENTDVVFKQEIAEKFITPIKLEDVFFVVARNHGWSRSIGRSYYHWRSIPDIYCGIVKLIPDLSFEEFLNFSHKNNYSTSFDGYMSGIFYCPDIHKVMLGFFISVSYGAPSSIETNWRFPEKMESCDSDQVAILEHLKSLE